MIIILCILAIVITFILIRAARTSNTMRIERHTFIKASPEMVFKHINNLKSHLDWSAWEKIDPNMNRTMGAIFEGEGATYEWSGNRDIGAGKITFLDIEPNRKVIGKIEFFSPMKAVNTLEYQLQEANGGTEISHAMYGPSPFISRVMCQFIDIDKMVGSKFEESLASLKVICEK
jgi:hypothetical protein